MTRIVAEWYNEVSEPDENKWCDWCGDINCKIHGPCGVCGNNNCSDHYEAIDNNEELKERVEEMKQLVKNRKNIVNPIHHPDVPDDLEELWRVTKNFVRGGGGDSNE